MFRVRCIGLVLALSLASAWARPALAAATNPGGSDVLPSAPEPRTLGVIHGTVTGPSGAQVGGIRVVLDGGNLATPQINITNRTGKFAFGHLAAGTYTVSASGPGYEPVDPTQVVLGGGEIFRLPIAVTPMPRVVSTVQVTASTAAIAKAQMKQEVQQRVLAVIPNFSTSFVWNAAPLTTKLKFTLQLRDFVDPFTIGTDFALAGVEQWHNTFPGYGTGWPGYGKRLGATLADSFDARMLGDALLPAVFHQDPRYFYHGGPNMGRRFFYAIEEVPMCRGDNKRQQFCYSRILGDFAAAGIANAYHLPVDRGLGITVRDGFIVLGTDAAVNLMREFLSKGLTSHEPRGPKGKPRKK
jgi:hypothetical protein